MTGRQKILQVLKDFKRESEISPNSKWVQFTFNKSIAGVGILDCLDEEKILTKLEKDKVIKVYEYEYGEGGELHLNGNPLGAVCLNINSLWIELLPSFKRKYFWYSITSFRENAWNFVNPFWLLWQMVKGLSFVVEWLWNKSKIVTLALGTVGTVSGLLVFDWSSAWKNLKTILIFLNIL